MDVAEAPTEEVVGFTHSGPERSGNMLYTGALYASYRFVDGKIEDDRGVEALWQRGEVWK